MGKVSKAKHHHKPAIERELPIEQIIGLFSQRFDEPYLNPLAELSFEAFANAFANLSRESLEDALAYWTNHSGQKLLQTKTLEGVSGDNRVWYVHGLSKPRIEWSSTQPTRVELR